MTKARPLIKLRTAPARAPRKDPIDLDRVIWDPEYRRTVCARLNREGTPPAPVLERRAG